MASIRSATAWSRAWRVRAAISTGFDQFEYELEREVAWIAAGRSRRKSRAIGVSFAISRRARWGRTMGRRPGRCVAEAVEPEADTCARQRRRNRARHRPTRGRSERRPLCRGNGVLFRIFGAIKLSHWRRAHKLPAMHTDRFYRRSRRPDVLRTQADQTCTGVRRLTSTGFSRARSPPTCRSQQPTKFELVINLQDRQGARPRSAADAARPRRRGDRVRRPREGGSTMKLPRRRFLHLAAGAAALPAVSRIAWAQTYPSRPVRMVVGFAARRRE